MTTILLECIEVGYIIVIIIFYYFFGGGDGVVISPPLDLCSCQCHGVFWMSAPFENSRPTPSAMGLSFEPIIWIAKLYLHAYRTVKLRRPMTLVGPGAILEHQFILVSPHPLSSKPQMQIYENTCG